MGRNRKYGKIFRPLPAIGLSGGRMGRDLAFQSFFYPYKIPNGIEKYKQSFIPFQLN
jgi:hypothetical protein